jgi:hypothetical protein
MIVNIENKDVKGYYVRSVGYADNSSDKTLLMGYMG